MTPDSESRGMMRRIRASFASPRTGHPEGLLEWIPTLMTSGRCRFYLAPQPARHELPSIPTPSPLILE